MKARAAIAVIWLLVVGVETTATSFYNSAPHTKVDLKVGNLSNDGRWYIDMPSGKSVSFDGSQWSPEGRVSWQYARAIICRDFPADAERMGSECETVGDPVSQSVMNWMFGIGRWAHIFGTDEIAKWAGRHFTASAIAEMHRPGVQSFAEAAGIAARRTPLSMLTGVLLLAVSFVCTLRRFKSKPSSAKPNVTG